MGINNENNAQIVFLNRIKHILGANKSLIGELSDILKISNDSVYRRMRGETTLTIDEITVLCNHFKISFDIISENTNGLVSFQYSMLKDVDGYMSHWVQTLNELRLIASSENKQIIYAAIDIPLFHHFKYPELASFKLFYWLKEIMHSPLLKDKKFDPDWILPELIEQSNELYTTYCKIPSIEIWTEGTVNSFLKQLEYYFDTGSFISKEIGLIIVDKAIEELNNISKMAESSSKIDGSSDNFNLYLSEIEIGNNCVLVKTDLMNSVFMGFLTFNTMKTTNQIFCNETEIWLSNIISKSSLISGVSPKQRYQFFKKVIQNFEDLKTKINNSN